MKAKFKINTGAFELNKVVREVEKNGVLEEVQAIQTPIPSINIDVEVEYSASEMLEMWKATKTIAEECPEVLKNLAVNLVKAYNAVEENTTTQEERVDEVC